MKYLLSLLLVLFIFTSLFWSINGACANDKDCNYGKCQNNTCKCDEGYITHSISEGECSYEQKEKLTAFLLSFLIGNTGADWFYLARDNGGKFKFYVFVIFYLNQFI